ncbi:unnamed protein product, partial [Didymodactylos carnosus]
MSDTASQPCSCQYLLPGFVAVHVGAGHQSKERSNQYKDTCKKACLNAIRALKNGKNASEAVCIAVAVLE